MSCLWPLLYTVRAYSGTGKRQNNSIAVLSFTLLIFVFVLLTLFINKKNVSQHPIHCPVTFLSIQNITLDELKATHILSSLTWLAGVSIQLAHSGCANTKSLVVNTSKFASVPYYEYNLIHLRGVDDLLMWLRHNVIKSMKTVSFSYIHIYHVDPTVGQSMSLN